MAHNINIDITSQILSNLRNNRTRNNQLQTGNKTLSNRGRRALYDYIACCYFLFLSFVENKNIIIIIWPLKSIKIASIT